MKKIIALAFLLLAITSFAQIDIDKDLVVYYPLDWNTDDSSGNGHHAVNGGASAVEGLIGGAYSFDGTDDYVSKSYHADFTVGSNSWTVSMWLKIPVEGYASKVKALDWYRCGVVSSCGNSDRARYSVQLDNPAKITYKLRDNTAPSATNAQSTLSYNDNEWHFITGIYDAQVDSLYLYIDKELISQVKTSFNSIDDGGNNVPLELGRHYVTGWGTPSEFFKGEIDEVRIHSRAININEIHYLYNLRYNSTELENPNKTIVVYPTATHDLLNIMNPERFELQLSLYDQNGKLIKSKIQKDAFDNLNITDLNAGLYFLHLRTKEGNSYRKIIKQ